MKTLVYFGLNENGHRISVKIAYERSIALETGGESYLYCVVVIHDSSGVKGCHEKYRYYMFLNFFVDEAQIEKKNIMSMRQLVELSVRKII